MSKAKDFFAENQRMFNAHTEPEKFNLYGGLFNLAKDIEEIKDKLRIIENDVNYIKVK